MSIFQHILSAFAAIVTAFSVTIVLLTNHSKATGLAAVTALTLLSWKFWLLAAFCFLLFFAASRIGNKILKGFLFWAPVTAISLLGLSYAALIGYVLLQVRRS